MIKISKIRILNYKSIYDSKDIIIQDRITVLAGKNESGKTNVLKALDAFYNDYFSEEDIPTKDANLNPTIIIDFSILGKYFNDKMNTNWLDDSMEYTYTIERSKNIKDIFSGRLIDEINKSIKEKLELCDTTEIEDCIMSISNRVDVNNSISIEKMKKLIFNIYAGLVFSDDDNIMIIGDRVKELFSISEDSKIDISDQIKEITDMVEQSDLFKQIIEIYNIIMPEFRYFDNFNDMIPDEIDISDLTDSKFRTNHRGFINLLAFFGISLEDFAKEMKEISRTPQTKLDKYSNTITMNYQKIYKQEKLKISLQKDGQKIYINIYDIDDDINPKKPSQRSKGLQWFISFYLMLNNSRENSILLIDEPGLYLHASAQEDILNFFEKKLDNYIIYTTHSPYLIDTNNMLRVKLVTNDRSKGNGTIIENKYYNCSDIDTITPIITAIGYNVARSPLELGGGLNIITEGVSDRYYILAFLKLFSIDENIHVVPSKGTPVIHLLVSIAIGWNLKYIVFIDNDDGEEDAREALEGFYESKTDYNNFVFKIVNKKNSSIEDIFSKEDKLKYGINKRKKEKLLNAKKFYDRVFKNEISLDEFSEETRVNISNVIQIVKSNLV